jgi:hypothetical protein
MVVSVGVTRYFWTFRWAAWVIKASGALGWERVPFSWGLLLLLPITILSWVMLTSMTRLRVPAASER